MEDAQVEYFSRSLPSSIRLTNEDEEDISNNSNPEFGNDSQILNSSGLAHLLSPPSSSVPVVNSYFHRPAISISYFNSTIESAMKERLEIDDEPIPFIDDNLSLAHSRKSSACWSDRTSLSSRFGFVRRFRQNRSTPTNELDNRQRKRRSHQRTNQLTIRPQDQYQITEQL